MGAAIINLCLKRIYQGCRPSLGFSSSSKSLKSLNSLVSGSAIHQNGRQAIYAAPLHSSTGPFVLCPSGPLHPGRLSRRSLSMLLSGGLANLFAVLWWASRIASPSTSSSSLLFLGGGKYLRLCLHLVPG